MASNFKISSRHNNGDVFMELSGDFDGSSACELINTLKTYSAKAAQIHIDTSSLSRVHPFGLQVFQKDCSIHNLNQCLTFKGAKGNLLASGRSRQS